MNTADIVVLAVIALMALIGLYRGFILTLFGLVGYVAAALAAKWYYPVVSEAIRERTGFFGSIKSGVLDRLEAYVAGNPGILESGGIPEELPLGGAGFPKTVENMLLNSETLKGFGGGAAAETLETLADAFAGLAVDALSILLIFIAAKLAISVLALMLDKAFSLPVVRTFNKAGGFLLGLAKGVFVVYLLGILMIPVASAFPESAVVAQLETSRYALLFFENNLLLQLIYTFISNGAV